VSGVPRGYRAFGVASSAETLDVRKPEDVRAQLDCGCTDADLGDLGAKVNKPIKVKANANGIRGYCQRRTWSRD